jgi:hypothetical protein
MLSAMRVRVLMDYEQIAVTPTAAATLAALQHCLGPIGDRSGPHVLLLTSVDEIDLQARTSLRDTGQR